MHLQVTFITTKKCIEIFDNHSKHITKKHFIIVNVVPGTSEYQLFVYLLLLCKL